jgi:hypothetical protein
LTFVKKVSIIIFITLRPVFIPPGSAGDRVYRVTVKPAVCKGVFHLIMKKNKQEVKICWVVIWVRFLE